ncbi:unnamed protein product [Symbiodinium sp. CCMP2592]|nr:unnamed protein product [Symbiodinium sp. CCMP2592]
MAARDKNAALAPVPAFLRKHGDETIFDVRRLIKDCLDVRSHPACVAKARTGSIIAYPVKEGIINEKTLKSNHDLLSLYAWFVRKYPKLYKSVTLHRAILNDCAKFWKGRAGEDAFEYTKWKPDGKAIKSMTLCLRRLRYRSKKQRDEMFGEPDRGDDEASEPEGDEDDEASQASEEETGDVQGPFDVPADDTAVDANPLDMEADAAIGPNPLDVQADAAIGPNPLDVQADAAVDPNPLDVQADAAIGRNPLDVQASVAMDPLEWASQRSPAVVAEVVSSPEAVQSREDLAKEQLQERLRALKNMMVLKREDTQLVPPDVLDQAANRYFPLAPRGPWPMACIVLLHLLLSPVRVGPLLVCGWAKLNVQMGAGLQPSHDTKPGAIVIEETIERGRLFRRPSTSDMEGLRCNLETKFAVEAATGTRDELQVIARPLASSKMGSIMGPGTRASNPDSIPKPCGTQQVSTLEPSEKDPALDFRVPSQKPSASEPCVVSEKTSTPDACVASDKTSTPDACVASQKKSKKPRRDSQQDAGPSQTAMNEANSLPEPVKVAEKDPLPELSDGNAAGCAADIPEVPHSFTRVEQRMLRKQKVAAQRKRKHGEDQPHDEAEGEDSEAPEPRGRGRARGRGGRGRGRGRGRSGAVKDDEEKPLQSLSRSRSPAVMKRPAAKGQVSTMVPKKSAEPKNKAKAVSEVPKKAARPKTKPGAASEAADRENGASLQDLLKLVLDGLPLLKAQAADMVKLRPDYNSRDVLPIAVERRGPLKQIAGCTQLSHV